MQKREIRHLNTISELEVAKTLSGFDINQIHSGGKNALFSANLEKSRWLIKNGINLNHIDHKRKNAVFYANTPEKLELLIESGVNLYHLDMYHRSFMYYMNAKMIKYLLSDKCSLDLTPIINKKHNTSDPLLFAIGAEKWTLEDFSRFVNKGGHIFARNKHKEDILSFLNLKSANHLIIPLMQNYKFKNIDIRHNNGCIPATYAETGNLLLALTDQPEKNKEIIDYLWENYNKEFRNMADFICYLHENTNQSVKQDYQFLEEYIVVKDKTSLEKTIGSINSVNNKIRI